MTVDVLQTNEYNPLEVMSSLVESRQTITAWFSMTECSQAPLVPITNFLINVQICASLTTSLLLPHFLV